MITRLLDALLAQDAAALEALRPTLDGDLAALADAALARLALRVPPAGSDAARLLLAVSGHPGLSLAEVAEFAGVAAPAAAARTLLDDGLVVDRRFERGDVWARTARGAQAVRVLKG